MLPFCNSCLANINLIFEQTFHCRPCTSKRINVILFLYEDIFQFFLLVYDRFLKCSYFSFAQDLLGELFTKQKFCLFYHACCSTFPHSCLLQQKLTKRKTEICSRVFHVLSREYFYNKQKIMLLHVNSPQTILMIQQFHILQCVGSQLGEEGQ